MFLSRLINKEYIKDKLVYVSFRVHTVTALAFLSKNTVCIEWNYCGSGYVPPAKAATIEGRCAISAASHPHPRHPHQGIRMRRQRVSYGSLEKTGGIRPSIGEPGLQDIEQLDEKSKP